MPASSAPLAVGGADHDELAATSRAAYRALVHDDPGFAVVLPRHHADRELSDLRLGSRPAARGPAREAPDRSIRCGPSRGRSPGRSRGSTCPAGTGSGTALEAYRAAHGEAGLDAIARLGPRLAVPLEPARQRGDEPGQGGHGRRPAATRRSPRGDGDDRRWAPSRPNTTGPSRCSAGSPAATGCSTARRCCSARSRCATRTSTRSPSSRSGCWPGCARCAPDDPERDRGPAAGPADRQRGRGRPPEHRLSAVDHADHVGAVAGGRRRPGGTWADIGAGSGAFTLALADLLGPGGRSWPSTATRGALRATRRPSRRASRRSSIETLVATWPTRSTCRRSTASSPPTACTSSRATAR